jgi:hypothetical protein
MKTKITADKYLAIITAISALASGQLAYSALKQTHWQHRAAPADSPYPNRITPEGTITGISATSVPE